MLGIHLIVMCYVTVQWGSKPVAYTKKSGASGFIPQKLFHGEWHASVHSAEAA